MMDFKKIVIAFCLVAVAGTAIATVENNGWNVIQFKATGDATGNLPASVSPGRVITAIRWVPSASSKYCKLHIGSTSGNVIWSSATSTANTAQDWPSNSPTVIPIPASGLAVSTDDTTVSLFVYTKNAFGN